MGLMGANVAVFLAWRGDAHFMLRHFTTSWDAVREGRVHTLVLSAFSQRDTWHLIKQYDWAVLLWQVMFSEHCSRCCSP